MPGANAPADVREDSMRWKANRTGGIRQPPVSLRAVRTAALVLAVIIAALLAAPGVRRAAAGELYRVRVIRRGPTVEMRFCVRAGGVRWHVAAHGDELRLDGSGLRVALSAGAFAALEQPPIKSVRVITAPPTARIVITVTGRCDWAAGLTRADLIVRVAPAGADTAIAQPVVMKLPRPAPHPARPAGAGAPNIDASPGGHRALVAIDPGHGGFDPGTRSDSGVEEKTLALQVALRLQAALERRGMRVMLTRSADYFVPLSQRIAEANRAHADLFVSVHVNWSPNPAASGIEVYYLNNTTDRATIRLAAMENGSAARYSAASGAPGLNYILSDLRQQDKAVESAELARMIERSALGTVKSKLGLRLNDLGARKGPFYVLVGAHMPAVLVECGFASNRVEGRELSSPEYQQAISDGIAQGIARFVRAGGHAGNL